MRVLSLFDGMACGMLAMQAAGMKVSRYVAFEIDKYAVQTSSHNFPMIEHRGDVFQSDFNEFLGFDFLVGGSPCTYWSIAKTKNRETEASGMGWELFCQYVRAVKEAKPKFFIYENNKSMSAAIRESIDEAFGFEAVCINSALVSAQNRQRLYWVGMRNEDGSYSKVPVDQPDDCGILLRDVLDNAVAWRDKAHTIDASYYKGGTLSNFTAQSGQRLMAAEPVNTTPDGKARTIRATCYKDGIRNMVGNDVDKRTCVAEPVIAPFDGYSTAVEWYENGNPAKAKSYADGKTYPVYRVENGKITIKDKAYPIKLADGYYIIRKLTVSECKRLQTVPEGYEFPVSDSQAYKLLGNGWTVDVIAHILKHIGGNNENQVR